MNNNEGAPNQHAAYEAAREAYQRAQYRIIDAWEEHQASNIALNDARDSVSYAAASAAWRRTMDAVHIAIRIRDELAAELAHQESLIRAEQANTQRSALRKGEKR